MSDSIKKKQGHFLLDEKQGGDEKLVIWVYYNWSNRLPLVIRFDSTKIKAAIEIAQEYSEDPEVLNVRVILNEMIEVARFAGFWVGRVYEN